MKTVLLMRHAKSSWDDPTLRDHARPLNQRGKDNAPRMGKLLNDEDLIPAAIFCSTAIRAQKTVDGVLKTLHFSGKVQKEANLYHADPSTYITYLAGLGGDVETAMIVGHNPEMNAALYHFTEVHEHMATACIAVLEFEIEAWSELNWETEGRLVRIWRPKEL